MLREAQSHGATCWYRESCCCAPWCCLSNKVPSHERAFYAPRTDHQQTGELRASVQTAGMKASFVRFKWEFSLRRLVKLIIRLTSHEPVWKCSAWTQPRGLNLTIKTAFALRDQYHLTFPGFWWGIHVPAVAYPGTMWANVTTEPRLEINNSGSKGQQRAISVKLGNDREDAILHGQNISRLHFSLWKLEACLMPLWGMKGWSLNIKPWLCLEGVNRTQSMHPLLRVPNNIIAICAKCIFLLLAIRMGSIMTVGRFKPIIFPELISG